MSVCLCVFACVNLCGCLYDGVCVGACGVFVCVLSIA